MSDFSLGDLRKIVRIEREMDDGLRPFVVDGSGNRWAVNPELMSLLQLRSGQRVSAPIIHAILEGRRAIYERELAKAADAETPPA